MEKKIQKLYLIDYNLLLLEDLWQAHLPFLLLILVKEMYMYNVNVQTEVHVVLNIQTLKMI